MLPQGYIEDIRFLCIDKRAVVGIHLGRDKVGTDGIGVDMVVYLRQLSFGAPANGFLLLGLQALELFDKIELELHRYPVGKLEGNVGNGVGAAITSCLRNKAYGIGGGNPLCGRQCEGVQTCIASKPLEFEGISLLCGKIVIASPPLWTLPARLW